MDPFSDDNFVEAIEKPTAPVDTGDDLDSFLESAGISTERPSLRKPWMKFHKFNLVKTAEEVVAIVDKAIAHGRCALDLETEGFDNRIDYDEEGHPSTRHQIVGYCVSVKGVGYYIPVRHHYNPRMGEKNPNVPNEDVVSEMTRLLQAARPEVEGEPFVHNTVPDPKVVIYFWNSKFDQEFLYGATGIELWHPVSFEDGMLAAYSIYSDDDLGLKKHAQRRLFVYDGDTKLSYEMIELEELFPSNTKKADRKMATLYPEDDSDIVLYGCSDAICTELLCETKGEWEFALPKVKHEYNNVVALAKAKHDFTYRLEKRTVQGVRDMERRRVLEDKPEIEALLEKAQVELERYQTLIVDLAAKHGFENFNPGSTQQLSAFLFEKGGLDLNPKPEKGASGQYSTTADTLEALLESIDDAPKVLEWIVKFRQVEKIIGTYLQSMRDNCDEYGQLRFKFNQTGAATGRFTASSGEPDHGYSGIPIQGIPARDDPKKPEVAQSLRRAFIARTGYTLVKIDYAGQELRIVSNLSKEPKWVSEFMNATKEGREADLHTLTAKAFFGDHITKADKKERNMGKMANFSLIYGGGTGAIMRATKCDKMEASRRKANFDKSVPVFAAWVKGQHAFVKKHKGVYTAFKRFLAIPDAGLNAGDTDAYGKIVQEQDVGKIRSSCERKSTNYPIQGCLKVNSLVLTKTGQQKIGDLAERGQPFEAYLGDRWVDATAHNMGKCQLAEILLSDGTTIECDTRHKLMIVTEEGQKWVPFKDLDIGMNVATSLLEPLEFDAPKRLPKPPFQISKTAIPDLWYWLGRYMGDGWLNNDGLVFVFGDHEEIAMERCDAFWRSLGYSPKKRTSTHTPRTKESTRHNIIIYSVELVRWLVQLGLKLGVTAHTKRCPDRIFSETLENRKAFMQGMFEADGHRPKLPQKIDGKWDRKRRGNPYNLHLCQRPLLEDFKRLLRTLGVETDIRGPYSSGEGTTSYRLDIQRRMYDVNVLGKKGSRMPGTPKMMTPDFLVKEFLSHGPFLKEAFQGNESAYNLYLRMKTGGKVGVYTLKFLCGLLGVKMRTPLYGYKRLVSKTVLTSMEETYTLNVKHPLHRFESDGVITKNSGADIMKLSLTFLLKEFILRGWRKEGGDDSVRVLMTVHDELVFEIRHDRLMESMPIIIDHMESPSKLAGWKIPLVVEPLLGLSWEAKYDWLQILKGEDKVPEWLVDHVKPGTVFVPKEKAKEAPKAVHATASVPPPPQSLSDRPPPKPVTGTVMVATFVLGRNDILSEKSVRVVFNAVSGAIDPDSGIYLRIVTQDGDVLVDVNDRFFVVPEMLQNNLNERLAGSIYHEVKEEAA